MTDEPFVISAKNLGSLAMSDYCVRCFWLKAKLNFQLPYQIFPSIFTQLDSYQKKITNQHYNKHGSVPEWLKELGALGEPLDCPHWSKFYFVDDETNIKVRGVADEILLFHGDSLIILDYKTAKFSKGQDTLLPVYKCQLNAYKIMAEQTMGIDVKKLALVYNEPVTDVTNVDDLVHGSGYHMKFHTVIKPIEIDDSIVHGLLYEARDIIDLPEPPEFGEECKDCLKLSNILNLLK